MPPRRSLLKVFLPMRFLHANRFTLRLKTLSHVSETHIEIRRDRLHQRLKLAIEEMIRAGDDLLIDHDALLRLELLDQRIDVFRRHYRILLAMDDQAGGRAGREEGEVVEIGGRRDRDETF